MTSPARRHFQAAAARAAAVAETGSVEELGTYHALLKQLHGDKALLKSISGITDKVAAKSGMLAAYQNWLDGVAAAGKVAESDKITPVLLVWLIDVGRLDDAMPIAQIAMTAGMESADEYQRTMPEIIIEQMAEQISRGAEISDGAVDMLVYWACDKNAGGLHTHDMPDQIRAKLLKAVAEKHEAAERLQDALDCYRQALKYNDKAGVKNRIAALEKQLAPPAV